MLGIARVTKKLDEDEAKPERLAVEMGPPKTAASA
jgi:hypothetical protein